MDNWKLNEDGTWSTDGGENTFHRGSDNNERYERDSYTDNERNNDDISTITKIIFATVGMLGNYFAYNVGWGWLFMTVPLTFFLIVALIEKSFEKKKRIKMFVSYMAILITILAPLPWWCVLIACVLSCILVEDDSNKLW